MPGRTLPTFTQAEVEEHNSKNSACYMTYQGKVYDLTDFVDEHPGGGQLLLDYASKDIEAILADAVSHTHSEAAYEILDESVVGFLVKDKAAGAGAVGEEVNGSDAAGAVDANGEPIHPRTGMSCEEDLSKDTDYNTDFKKHKFLDLNQPLLMQLWRSGHSKAFYLDQVHRPRHYKGGKSAPLFGNFLEPLSLTPWWLVPTIWLPCVLFGLYQASRGLGPMGMAGFFGFGLFLWTLIEYCLHRFLFHLDE